MPQRQERVQLDVLIGHTGFVGGALAGQHAFDRCFNSTTIAEAAGLACDTLVCAAAPGSMVEANRQPARDLQRIHALTTALATIRPRRVVLISTIAVLGGFASDGEDAPLVEPDLPYGRHRLLLERFVADRFAETLIVRLPALFGPGLKKNFLFDLLNPVPSMMPGADVERLANLAGGMLRETVLSLYREDAGLGLCVLDRTALDAGGRRERVEAVVRAAGLPAIRFTHRDSRFQFYDMAQLWADIERARAHGIDLLHLAPPPIAAATIHQRLTGRIMPETPARLHREDMRTRHAALWGQDGPYIATPDAVLAALERFARSQSAPA